MPRQQSYPTVDSLIKDHKNRKTYFMQCVFNEENDCYDIMIMFWNGRVSSVTNRVNRVQRVAIDRYVRHLLSKYGKLGLLPDKVFGVLHGDTFVKNDNNISNTSKDQKNGKGNSNEQASQPPIRSYSESQESASKGFVI